jgi:hypothetical protein
MDILITLFFLLTVGFILLYSGYSLLSGLNDLHQKGGSKPILYIKKIAISPVVPGLCLWMFHVYVALFVHDGCIPGPDTILGIHQSNFAFLFLLEFLIFICVGILIAIAEPHKVIDLLRFKKDNRHKISRGSDWGKWIFRFWQLIYIALSGVIVGQCIRPFLFDV